MILHPVKASGWLSANLSVDEQGVLKSQGIVPIPDKLYPYWGCRAKIQLYYGGRGGGKSFFIFKKLINECISSKYFKCFYGRKVFETIRESCFATLVSCIESMGLDTDFDISRTKEGSMVVTHISTGNKFIPFGSDKSKKLKSLENPTHVFFEEFEEAEFDDFKELLPTLRTQLADTFFIAAFNTHNIYPAHWIIRVFFPEYYQSAEGDKADADLLKGVDIVKCLVNYYDNHFIDREAYRQTLWLSAGGNLQLFNSIANGEFGVPENNKPWLYGYDNERHVIDHDMFAPAKPVYLSFDFNNDPISCIASQFDEYRGDRDTHLAILAEFVGTYSVQELCERIRTRFPNSIFYITGDRSGHNKDTGRENLYAIIAAYLKVPKRLIQAPQYNLPHADSRVLCNLMFANYPNLTIHSSCKTLINDCMIATVDDKGSDMHKLKKDRGIYKMDAFDAMRYLMQTYFHEFCKKHFGHMV